MSDDNVHIESLIRTAKYRPGFLVHGVADITATREWVHGFVGWYRTEHRHSAIRFVTPVQRHDGADIEILSARKRLNEVKKLEHPERLSGDTRNCTAPGEVWLNPERATPPADAELKSAA